MRKAFFKMIAASLAALTLVSCAQTGDPQDTTAAETTPSDPSANTNPVSPGVDVMKFELSDHVLVKDISNLSVTNNVYCDDEELADILRDFAVDAGILKKLTDRKTKEGDTLNISYAGRVEGVYFEGGTSNNATVVLTENNGYIEGFADDLYGIMPGTKVETEVTFPEDYGMKALAGVDAVFEITVNFICDYTLDDLDVKNATGGKFETVEAFSQYCRNEAIKEKLTNYESTLSNKIIELLTENCEIVSYPEELVKFYYDDIEAYYKSLADSSGISLDTWLSYYGVSRESFTVEAERYAREDLALHAIFVAEGLTMSEADYRIKLNDMALQYKYPSADALESQYGEFFMKNTIRKNMCIEHMKKKINVVTDYTQYEHLLKETAETTAEGTN